MAIVHEETSHDDLPVTIMVSERTKGEFRTPWEMIDLEFDSFQQLTPTQLRQLGRWLIQEGKRIGREYKSNGAPKKGGAQ
ncbi:hypothetical protein [Chromobacterium haemolyticum]|uniref:hypothetical protein n=1 Tax=Chromobacterium haemolyticum TaxID=394935 RepID=UPI000D30F91D|nr:hypothetical protein [Chromobacterium haemolyticum]PTU71457.1 hypothetical protein DBB33_19380 [Chromobacterium haemolyticum]